MPVKQFNPTDLPQSAANWDVARRIVGAFAPHAQIVPSAMIVVDPGHILTGGVLIETNAQSVGPFAATPSQRVDRVVVSRITGVASVVAGVDGSTTAPALPPDTLPVARVHLQAADIVVTNAMIYDERAQSDVQPASATAVICRAHMNGANQSLSVQTDTVVNLTAVSINISSGFDTTNKRFKPNVAGYYQFSTNISYASLGTSPYGYVKVLKNGTLVTASAFQGSPEGAANAGATDIVYLDGSTDYLQLLAYYRGSAGGYVLGLPTWTWFAATKLY